MTTPKDSHDEDENSKNLQPKDSQFTYMSWLPTTAGWSSLSETKREWLQKRTSNIASFRNMQKSGLIGESRELFLIQKGLVGERMTMEAYLAAGYGKSVRTGWRKLTAYKKLRTVMSDKAIEKLTEDTDGVLQGTGGLGVATAIRVAKKLPQLKTDDPKAVEGYVTDFRNELRKERQDRHKKQAKPDEDRVLVTFVRTGINMLKKLEINDSAGKRKILTKGVSYIMQESAIFGTIKAERASIPDDFFPTRGAPRKYPEDKE